MPITLPTEQKKLQALVDRRHPSYGLRLKHWDFCRATHDGGRDWFKDNLFQYIKEGNREFKDRLDRAYRFNHTREVVKLVTKYIFKGEVQRNTEDAPERLQLFWRRATHKGESVDALMRRVDSLTSIYGRIWLGVDTVGVGPNISLADEKEGRAAIYAFTVTPDNVLDYSWDQHGDLLWLMFRVTQRDDVDPVESSGEVYPRYIIWTRDSYAILDEKQDNRRRRVITVTETGKNEIGMVPLFPVDDAESDDPYDVPALIGDIAYLDRAIANYLSNLDAIIQDQTFSQLVIPAQGLLPGSTEHDALVEAGTKRLFAYDGEAGGAPAYISPDPKQAGVILAVVNKIIAEIYHSVGMAGERTKQDNAVGIDNSSGVAKAYDFERVNSLLAARADVLERAEDRLAMLVGKWSGIALPTDDLGEQRDLVKYPDSFDVRGIYDEFEIAEKFALIMAPDELRREQLRGLVDKLWPRLGDEIRSRIEASIKDWPPDPLDMAALASPVPKPGAPGRQGQVTPTTKATPKGSRNPK